MRGKLRVGKELIIAEYLQSGRNEFPLSELAADYHGFSWPPVAGEVAEGPGYIYYRIEETEF